MAKPLMQQFRIRMDNHDALRMTCVNAGCEAERQGWATVLDVQGNDQHAGMARYIEQDSGRHFIRIEAEEALEWLDVHGAASGITVTPRLHELVSALPRTFVVYLFPPGQQCFRPHLDREVHFAHRKERLVLGIPKEDVRVHTRPLDFNEDMNIEGDRVNRLIQAG